MNTDDKRRAFHSLYSHGFCRAAVATPRVFPAEPSANARETLALAFAAAREGAILVLYPELGLSGYAIDDLLLQDALLDSVEASLAEIAAGSKTLNPMLVVGAPLRAEGKLFNCAVVIHRGGILGVVPKSYIPTYREFYERRQFCAAAQANETAVRVFGNEVPFGNNLLFEALRFPGFVLHVEICEDLWVPIPPSTHAALAGATVLANLSASNVTIGKADYRRLLCASQSGRAVAAYLYAGAGFGESTTDLAWDGHAMIYENGNLLVEGERFSAGSRLIFGDIDLDRLVQERSRLTSFADCAATECQPVRRFPVPLEPPAGEVPLRRPISRFPYVPGDAKTRDERCQEVYRIQVQGLAKRLDATGLGKVVIGVSGGLDSAYALLVAAGAVDCLQLPRANILAYSLPGFATGHRTRENAKQLMQTLGTTMGEVDIRPSAMQMLRDIGHPFSHREPVYDTVFENVQAGERSSHLFRLANRYNALVIGTSDLSELALGYTTYGIGDQMAHYSVNASVPKTLMRHLIQWLIEKRMFAARVTEALENILSTPASPELVPAAGNDIQRAENEIGPYELHDFSLYYLSRYGYRPSKIAFLAEHAWSYPTATEAPPREARTYDLAAIKHWLEVFLQRFIAFSQFKRSALPNGPKVGSGGSLSPRGDWRAPSDVKAEAWIEELRRNVP